MLLCLAICATCAYHLIRFSEESLLVGVINYYRSGRRQHFTEILFDIMTKPTLIGFPKVGQVPESS